MAATRANQNRKIRQDALREQLANAGHHQHVFEILKEINELDPEYEYFGNEIAKRKLIIDTKLALMKKYIPDLKAVELTGDDANPVAVSAEWILKPAKAPQKTEDK